MIFWAIIRLLAPQGNMPWSESGYMSLLFIIFIILVALVFDFTNGMHDAANSISTIVSTRVLSPRQAVVWAAFFNFRGFSDI